jgi:hypothetical protein
MIYGLQLRCELVSASEQHRVAREYIVPPSGTQGVPLMRSRNAEFPTVCAASRALCECPPPSGVAYRPRPSPHAMSSRVGATPMTANAARTADASPTAVTVTPARRRTCHATPPPPPQPRTSACIVRARGAGAPHDIVRGSKLGRPRPCKRPHACKHCVGTVQHNNH